MTFCRFIEKNFITSLRAAMVLCIFAIITALCGCSSAEDSPTGSGSSQTDDASPGASQADGTFPESSQADGTFPEASQADGASPETSQADGTFPEASQADDTFSGASQTDGTFPEASQADGTFPESDSGLENGSHSDSENPAAAEISSEVIPGDSNSSEIKTESDENPVSPEHNEDNEDVSLSFYAVPVEDDVFIRMYRCSYPEDCTIELSELRYVHILHYDFNGNICEGELIVNAAIAEDIRDIFLELFRAEYPIEKVRLVDEYDADDEASMLDNNTSAFNYRTIAGTNVLSLHARGLAIDINPFYNPYVVSRTDGTTIVQPAGAEAYTDRSKTEPYIIKKADVCYNAFISRGFTWGGDWNTKKDYQHFEKDIE